MGINIADMTPATSLAGTELLPASVAGAPRSVATALMASHTIDEIEAIESAVAVSATDEVYILQGGALKPVDIDLITQRAIDIVWGKDAHTTAADTDVVPVLDGGTTEKTMTLTVLATYIQSAIRAAVLNLSTLAAADTLAGTDIILVTQGAVGKRTTLSAINSAIYASFYTWANSLSELIAGADEHELYVMAGGVNRKITLATVKAYLGISGLVSAPPSSTENKVPQWSATSKTLKDGLAVVDTLPAAGVTTGNLVSDTGIRAALDAHVFELPEGIKPVPVDADELLLVDSEDDDELKKISISELTAAIVPEATTTVTTKTETGTTYTLALADAGKYIRMSNANAIALTVPLNATAAFAIGTTITIEQALAGVVTIAGESTVNVRSFAGLLTAGQYSVIQLIKLAADEWIAIGGVAA